MLMRQTMLRSASITVGFCLLALVAGGCQCSGQMRTFDVTVTLDQSLASQRIYPSVEVDLIGTDAAGLAYWNREVNVSSYFEANSRDRAAVANRRLTFLLGQESPSETKSLSRNQVMAVWEQWKKQNVQFIVVLSDFPRLGKGRSGEEDPRRRIIPLDCSRWKDDQRELRISVRADGVGIDTPPLPKLN